MKGKIFLFILSIFLVLSSFASAEETKIKVKNITKLADIQEIQLFGYGLVVGLNGTGDRRGATFTEQSITNMLQNMGISIDEESLRVKNCAAVMVTCTISPFIKPGSRVDVVVSSLGNATSLEGGTLLLTPLRAADGEVYVLAQGAVSIGGFNVEEGGAGFRKNHPTVGKIPGGGIVKRSASFNMPAEEIKLVLSHPDFTTAVRISEAINREFSRKLSTAVDAGLVKVKIPGEVKEEEVVDFISRIQNLEIVPQVVARVVINERTGTVVIGNDVRISPVAVAHGNIFVSIERTPVISQPPAFSQGETVVEEKTKIEVKEEKGRVAFLGGATVRELVESFNALGVTPRDMIAIFQALKEAGALQAELIIM